MFNLSLTACSFSIKKLHSRRPDKVFELNHEISGVYNERDFSANSVKELFEAFFLSHEELEKDVVKKQTFSCTYDASDCQETSAFRMIYAQIQSGVYGTSSDILDADTLSVKLKKSSSDIDVRPFYVFVIIPKDSENLNVQKGMFIFQNIGPYGVKTITTDLMQRYFSENFGITLTCKTIAPDLFVRKVIRKDNTKKLVMVKNVCSADIADSALGYGKEVREIGDLRFTETLWENLYQKIQWVAGGRHNLFEFENNSYDTLKVVVDIGGRNRTIDLHNLDNLSIIEAVPDEIRQADGHPDKEMLIEYFKQVASEYLEEMVLRIS